MKSKPRAISNTSFISVMHDMGYLNLCSEMFEKIYVSQSVYDEVKQSGMCYLMAQIEELIRTKFIITKKCDNVALVNSLMSFLGSGEAETITLALELKDIEVVING